MEENKSEGDFQVIVVCERCSSVSENLDDCLHCTRSGSPLVKPIETVRVREITPYGMYLKQLKLALKQKNTIQKIDLAIAHKNWIDLSEEDKFKYKNMSLEDKLKVQLLAGKKSKADGQEKSKKIKRKNDSERMVINRGKEKVLKEDVKQSKKIVLEMLDIKKAALLGMNEDIAMTKDQIDDITRELEVTEKIVFKKKEKLKLIKKEFKELFKQS